MSGQAGWSIRADLYSIFVGSGRFVSVAIPPGGSGASVAEYFERANLPYRDWLERAQPRLDALFAQLVIEGLPLVRSDAPCEEIDGVVIERPDEKADHYRKYSRGLPGVVQLRRGREMPDGCSMNLRLVVSTRVQRVQLDGVTERVVAILRETHSEPPEPPSPPESVPSRTLAARAWAWLRRR